MAQQSRVDLQTTINTNVNDNTNGDISAEDIRSALTNLNDSAVNKSTDTGFLGMYAYSTTQVYYSGQITQYDYKWYKANTTTTAGAFDSAQWTFQSYITYSGSLTIETADVLLLNTTPKTLVAAIASRMIRIQNCRAKLTYNTVAYATNTTLNIYQTVSGASNSQFTIPIMLIATATQYRIGTVAAAAQLAVNAALMVTVNTGDPTAGNSQIVIYFDYQVVE